MFTLKLLLKRSCWTFIFMALALPVSARVCFLPDSTDCGEGGVNMPDVQVKVTCATYGGYETPEACSAALKDKTAQTCILNSGCYYPKCAYDSERNCKRENPNKNCLSKNVEGVKCWYSKLKTCSEQGYKTACSSDENSTEVDVEASGGPCYICTPKKNCNQLPGKYYGPKDTCPQYTDREDAGISAKDGKCSVCKPQACTTIDPAYKNEKNKDTCSLGYIAKIVDGTNDAVDGPCYTCELGTVDIVKPVITITYKETYNSLEPSTGADPDEYYYKTLKFTATSSDTINRTIQMKTYPSRTCPKYATGSPVTIKEGEETTYSSSCGVSSVELLATSTAALDVFINDKQVYRFTPSIMNPREDFAQLDGKTVEAQGYTLKFVKGSSSTDPNEGKTYYVLLERNVEAIAKYYIRDSNIEANDTSNVGGLTCKIMVRGKIKYPDVSGDTFMNKVYFGTKIAGYIDFKESGFGSEDNYSEKPHSWINIDLMSDVNNRTIPTTWGEYIKTSPLPCEYKDLYSAYSALNASDFWVGFNSAKLDNDANKLDSGYSQRCKTLTKNGSSRTICVKYDDEQQQYDCSHWGLISEDNYCSYSGEQFKCTISPDATHPEDDFKHKCGKQNSAAFSFSSKHCPVWSDSGSSKCSYYPEGYAAKPGFKTENRLLNNYIILWLNNDDKIEFAVENYGNRRLVPAKQEYVVMATIKSTEMVNEFGNRIDDLRQFYQLFIDQTLNNKTCFMYMNPFVSSAVDVSENTWNEYEKLTSGSSRRCTQILQGNETSYSGMGYLTSSTATSSVGKWFNGKTINDFVDKAKWKEMISSGGGYYAYIWYRITPSMKLTKTNTVEEFTVYPGCTRDVAAPMSQCFYGWAEHGAQNSNRCSRFCPDLSNVYMFK